MTDIDPDIDHLYEAAQQAKTTPNTRAEYLARGQVHALIAIAQELRTLRQYFTAPFAPIAGINNINIGDFTGSYSETEYPYGRQV